MQRTEDQTSDMELAEDQTSDVELAEDQTSDVELAEDQTGNAELAHILLVEDCAGDTLLVQQALDSCPLAFKLHIARDGEQALQMLADPNLKLDLVILDLNLPRITGLGVLERYDPKDVPVVVFSGSSRHTDREFALALGASEYVQKPSDVQAFTDVVCQIVANWLGRKQTGTTAP